MNNIVVPFRCEKCTLHGQAEIGLKMAGNLNIGPQAKFIIGECPNQICKARLVVPSGYYRQHEGLMVYAGEFQPPPPRVLWWNRLVGFFKKG